MNPESVIPNVSAIDQGLHLATSEILFNRILVATDFSKPAEQALKMAISVSQLFGSKLCLMHAAAAPIVYGIDATPVPPEVVNADLDAEKKQMSQLVLSEPGLSELKPKVVVAYADAVGLINQISIEDKADLIIMGSHGASGLEKLALGSVAEAVLHQARCPVLIVGPNCKTELHPFRSVLFATDLKTTGLRGAQYAAALAERFHANLTFLHVVDKKSTSPSVDLGLIPDRINHELEHLLPSDVERYCKAKIRVEYGKPAEVITSVAQSECVSLVVVGLRDRALAEYAPWSTLAHVIREVNCAVLGVRGHLV